MKSTLAIITSAACLLNGCAQMGTRQTDRNTTTRYEIDKAGKTNSITTEVRETTTRASGKALFQASSTFEGLDIGQDGGDQGLKVKKASQKTDGMSEFVDSLRAAKDIGAMFYGIPPSQSAPAQPAAPAGMKWILAPKDQPSTPKLETE